ncbi:MAG: glycosyltransferase family 4 protein [Actinomycetota bacterium]|nr:glycosyltransferase family 4 protein [Actinomycetota bacterium]
MIHAPASPLALTSAPDLVGCTTTLRRDLPAATLLARRFLDLHPGADFTIAIVDPPAIGLSIDVPGVHLVTIAELDAGPARWQHLVTMFEGDDLTAATKPFLLRDLLRAGAACAVYLAPWIQLHRDLGPIVDRARAKGWAVTPQRARPSALPGGAVAEQQLLQQGIYNLDFLGVTPAARPFLDWWAERLFADLQVDDDGNLRQAHQRWVDVAVPLFGGHVERDPAYNLGYWNLDQIELRGGPDGPSVGGEPLRFFNFDGYDPARPWLLSGRDAIAPRVRLTEHPVAAQLCDDYRAALGSLPPQPLAGPSAWAATPHGVELRPILRHFVCAEVIRALAKGDDLPPTPFDDDGGTAFDELLTSAVDVPLGLPLLVYLAWCEQSDLRTTFADLHDAETRAAFFTWIRETGVKVFGGWAELGLGQRQDDRRPVARVGNAAGGIDVLGYLTAEVGLGEAARRLVSGLRAAGVPVSTVDCDLTPCRRNHPFPTDDLLAHDTLLIAANADALGPVIEHLGADLLPRRLIGQWFWEVERFPPSLAPAIDVLDEIWVPTEHIANSLRPLAGDRVQVVPIPLTMEPARLERVQALPRAGAPFTFLFMFDHHSVFHRKNPLGVIDAFRLAFDEGEGPRLVIKSMNGEQWAGDREELRWAARDRADIELIEGYLDPDEIDRLLWACDCYVSLHRAEGLGLTLVDAVNLGKPVIATAYSGNVDFLTPETALLVPYLLERIGPGSDPYPADGRWAAPDVQVAAAAMRSVVEAPEAAADRAARARADIAERFSPEETGAVMRQRLEALVG